VGFKYFLGALERREKSLASAWKLILDEEAIPVC
jgi:hypothetical protein